VRRGRITHTHTGQIAGCQVNIPKEVFLYIFSKLCLEAAAAAAAATALVDKKKSSSLSSSSSYTVDIVNNNNYNTFGVLVRWW
jgi:hypothetical protein